MLPDGNTTGGRFTILSKLACGHKLLTTAVDEDRKGDESQTQRAHFSNDQTFLNRAAQNNNTPIIKSISADTLISQSHQRVSLN